MVNNIADTIKLRLSLREPLKESLDVLVQLTEQLELKKTLIETAQGEAFLSKELEKVKTLFPTCTNFEREFISLAFSIATGVGKTRLMGAFISYLYLKKGVRNFFVLAPNLTIYNKLIEDFGNPAHPKYVFNGISEFVHNRPVIITGDNYAQQGGLFKDDEVRINIFNIAKFNSDNRGTKQAGVSLAPKIKRLSEYLGESYWQYLSNLDDLVILMDEAHRYHADASKNAINELKPILGLELTATPFDEKGKAFKNIVYEYSLAQALAEGKFVKSPAIAKRKNFLKGALTEKEVELIKLEDAVSIHLTTKAALEIYAKNNELTPVKPFILVVCKDIAHAQEVFEYVNSDQFYDGQFKGKVLQIDSSTRKQDDIERRFIALEAPENVVEIVIHVNMLKEGWDVTNLYTIVPLRAANAAILVEQTIGRGLRLPYGGKRTGVDAVDKLTIVAHDNFDAVIEAAKDPNSILNKISFVEIAEEDLNRKTVVITAKPKVESVFEQAQESINMINDITAKQHAQNGLDAKKAIIYALPYFNTLSEVRCIHDLNTEEVKCKVIRQIEIDLNKGQANLFASQILQEAEDIYYNVVSDYQNNIIEIPLMDLMQADAKAVFNHFDLDTTKFTFQALDQEIIRIGLKDQKIETIEAKSSGAYGDPLSNIIAALLEYPEIDYDDNSELLYHLAGQAYNAIRGNLVAEQLPAVIFQFKASIASGIYLQMKKHFVLQIQADVPPKVFPFVKIEPWNFSALVHSGYKDYRDVVTPISMIPKYVFGAFEKACHFEYKFDSKAEQDLAYVLENDKLVLKWMRPAPKQFRIYWDNNSKQYEPDFVVETEKVIYMIEVKALERMNDKDVVAKKLAAIRYCRYASEFTAANKGKLWSYLLIPHTEIARTIDLQYLVSKFG